MVFTERFVWYFTEKFLCGSFKVLFVCALAGYEMEKRAVMQGSRYCPGVIQPVYNRFV